MRKSAVATFSVIVIAAALCFLFYAVGPMQGLFADFNTREVQVNKTIAAAGIDSIDLSAGSADVEIVPGDAEQIRANLHGRAGTLTAKRIQVRAQTRGDTLYVSLERPGGWLFGGIFGWMTARLTLTVELPEKQWKALQVAAASGNIRLSQIRSDQLSARTGSGKIALENAENGGIALRTGSGDITANHFRADKMTAETGSGDIRLTDGEAKLTGQTGSGNIRLETDALRRDADLRTGSGDVDVRLASAPSSLAVDVRTGSGSERIEWDGFAAEEKSRSVLRGAFGDGGVKLTVRTGSGDFTLGR